MINVVYLAKLADLLGLAQEQLDAQPMDTDALLLQLTQRDGPWQEVLTQNLYKIAVNNRIVHGNTALRDGDTVALLPPVTGG